MKFDSQIQTKLMFHPFFSLNISDILHLVNTRTILVQKISPPPTGRGDTLCFSISPHLNEFGGDADGDFGGGLGADGKANGPMNGIDTVFRDAGFH